MAIPADRMDGSGHETAILPDGDKRYITSRSKIATNNPSITLDLHATKR